MKIVVCMKPVPDPQSRIAVAEHRKWIRETDLIFVASEADTYALEAGLRLREAGGGEVIALSLGGAGAGRVLRTGLAMGADRAIHLADEGFLGGDEFSRARVIQAAIEKDGGADLVLTGVQSDDLGTGITGILLAELLGWAHASVVIGLEAAAGELTLRRELENGVHEVVRMVPPAVLTIQFGINQPRYPSLKGIMAAKKKEMKVWSSSDLGLETGEIGAEGALWEVHDLFVPERRSQVEILEGSPVEEAAALVERLRKEAKVI